MTWTRSIPGTILGVDYYEAEHYEEAIQVFEETLSARRRVLGPEHPDTLTSRENLASCYLAVGRVVSLEAALTGTTDTG